MQSPPAANSCPIQGEKHNVKSVGGLGDFAGTFEFELAAEGTRLSGSGKFNEKLSGSTTNIRVDPAAPLVVNVATGEPASVANSPTAAIVTARSYRHPPFSSTRILV